VEPPEKTAQASIAPDTKRYSVLYADPWSAMTLGDLCAQPVPAADDSVLLLRARRLDDGLRLLESWGFVYADNIVWNMGGSELKYCVRYQHELFLIGIRGATLTPASETELPSILCAATAVELADQFAAMFPTLPKVELFTQRPRAGWDSWSPEVGPDDAPVQMEQHATADLVEAVAICSSQTDQYEANGSPIKLHGGGLPPG
jgi:N6-adenosine-specific RNA methylase IME4